MAEFEAKITGIADLSKAKQDFDAFKKQLEQPIKITVDASGFNTIWGNIQKQAQQQGSQIGKTIGRSLENDIKNVKVNLPLEKLFKDTGATSIASHLGIDVKTAQAIKQELKDINKEGASLSKLTIGNNGKSFEAIVESGNTAITVLGRLEEEENKLGITTSRWVTTTQKYTTDFSSSMKQAQVDAQKLSQDLEKVGKAFSNGDFSANVATMTKQLNEVSDTVSQNLVQKANDAANEYKRITDEIAASLANPAQATLQGQGLVDAYKQSEDALKRYRNAMKEVRADTTKMFAEGANIRAANDVEAWAKKNSRALKQYGSQLELLAQQMRDAKSAGELSSLQNQFKNLKSEINAAGLGGLTFGDQLKKAFVRIGEFTGIYAITSQIKQLPREMVQEVIKIDTAMTELRKVSTASASEISDYFDHAADSAYKYGQAINEVIDSTASWTRLGYKLEDASKLTDVTNLLAKVGSGLNVDSATEGLQATLRGFQLEVDQAEHIGDIINGIADTQPIDAIGIINGLERSSSAMKEANNTLEETVGLLTASTSVTQDATSAGTAWRTVALRIRGAKTELEEAGLETEGMATSVSKLRDDIKALSGVDIMESDGQTFKSTYRIIEELSKVWGQLSDISRANILEQIAGKRGAVPVSAALQNFDIARNTMTSAMSDVNGSMEAQLSVWEGSIQASLDRFHVAFQELSADLINSDFVKAIVDVGTTIIRIIDEMVKHIGVLGTAVTGLGIAKITSTLVNGAKSVDGWSGVFKIAIDTLAGSTDTMVDKGYALQAIFDGISAKAAGAGGALKGLGGVVGGVLSNPVALGVGAAALAGFTIYKTYKKQQEDLARQASATTDSWNESKAGIEEYQKRYRELNEQLSKENISEAERIGIKQQLLDLQNEIVAKYGEQASSIDLVNGSLQTQLSLIGQISEKEAKRNLQDNSDAYKKSVDEMTKTRTYSLSGGGLSGGMYQRAASDELKKQIDELYTSSNFTKDGDMFKFTGDASDFDEAVRDVIDGLEKLNESASESDSKILQAALDSAKGALKKNNEVLKSYQDNYKAYLEQSLYADGFGDELSEYARLTAEYNDSLLSGNNQRIIEAKTQLDGYEETVSRILEKNPEYGDFFNEIADSVDTTTEAIINFKDIIDDGIAESTNNFGQYSKEIKRISDNIKAMGIDDVDVQTILKNGGVGFGDLSELAQFFNKDFDFSDDGQIKSFADILAQLGLVASSTSENIDYAGMSFDDFLKSASASIETVDKVNGALVNAFASGGLSIGIDEATGALTGDVATIVSAYSNLESYNPQRLFERTADGIIVNTKALREMRAEQEATLKESFAERIQEAQENLTKAIESGNEAEINTWKQRLQNVQLLSTAYDGATSAYQKWLDAQKGGEMGDQYDTVVSTALKRGKELYDKGLVGTNEFRAIAQMYSNEDLSTASIDEITEAYENGTKVVSKYFTEGQEGAVAFADKLVELGEATKDSEGNYDFSQGIDTENLANELGISVDLVEAAFKKLNDYGFDIHFVSPETADALVNISEKANEAQDKLKELANAEGMIGTHDFSDAINLDVDSLDTVAELDDALAALSKEEIDPKVNPAAYEAFSELLDQVKAKRDLLTGTEEVSPLSFDSLSNGFEIINQLQNRIDSIGELNESPTIDIDVNNDDEVIELANTINEFDDDKKVALGFEVDDSIEDIISKVQNQEVTIPAQFSSSTDNVTAGVSVDASGVAGQIGDISVPPIKVAVEAANKEIDVVAKLVSTEVDNYKPQNLTASVTYNKDSLAVDSYNPPNFNRTVTYDISVSGSGAVDNLPSSGDRYITYHVDVVGDTPPAYKGTVPRSTFQGMMRSFSGSAHAGGGIALKQDENALINELGAEIVVRPSEDAWMIFNDGKPTLGAPLRKGDIIFNAEESKKLLERGWADDYAHMLSGGSFAGGTVKGKAHAAIGGGRFKKKSSSGSSGGRRSGGGGGGGNGGGSGSNDDAKEFNEILDEIQINIDRIERDIKNLDTIASDVFTNLTGRTTALNKELAKVRKEIKVQQVGYSRYLSKANSVGLNGTWAARVRAGENLTIDDVGDEDLWDKIQEYQKWYELALDCRDAIYQLKVNEGDLWQQRFDVRQTDFENQIEQIQHAYEMFDSFIEKAENTGRITSNTLKIRQLDQERSKVVKLQEEYTALEGVMAEALRSGEITRRSEGYYGMLNTLNGIREQIAETTTNIEKLNKEIRETDWEIFDRAVEKIENINDELEFLYGILGDEDKFYDNSGNVTNEGISAFGILSAQYNVAMQEAQKYADEIRKINKDIASDPYNQDLIDRQEELRESQRDAIEDAEKYKDSIVDLVKDGIKSQIDAIKELIDNYNDLLDAEKEEHNYSKKVSSAQENINKLQKQLNAYANDDSEEGMARRQKLASNLKNAQDSLAETEEERRISQTKKLLSDLQQEYEDILNARLDNIDNLIQAVIDGVDVNSSIIKEAITTAAQDVGYALSENASIIFNNASSSKDLASYFTNGGFVEKVTSIADAVKNIDTYIQNAIKNADQTQTSNISKENSATSSTESTLASAAQTGSRVRNNTNKISGVDGSWSKNGGNWEWTFNDGEKATGWSLIDSKWYSFEDNGRMRENEWFKDSNGKYYHLSGSGAMDTNRWLGKDNTWSYVDGSGAASTGWKYLKWSGGNDWFYFNDKGNMLTGLQNVNGKNYYMDTRTGAMVRNKWINSGGKWYYMDGHGAASTGWQKLKWGGGNDWFYFNGNGEMLTGMQNIGGNMYYMNPKDGTMAKNQWINSDGKWYYMGESGAASKGWNYLKWGGSKDWYYFNPDGSMKKNEWFYDPYYKAWYWFTNSGAMARNGQFKTKDGMKWFDGSGKWKGYKSGTKSVGADGLYWTNEGMPETIVRKSDGAILTRLNSGDTVFNGDATKTMWDFANNPAKFLRGMGVSNTYGSGNNVNLEFNLSGLRSPTEFMNALRKDKQFEKFIQEITIGRVNGHGSLAKNAIKF